jgi:hypothetical protein
VFVLAMQGWVPADKQLAGFRDLACPKAAEVYVTETNNRPSFGLAAFCSTTYILSQCSLRIWRGNREELCGGANRHTRMR